MNTTAARRALFATVSFQWTPDRFRIDIFMPQRPFFLWVALVTTCVVCAQNYPNRAATSDAVASPDTVTRADLEAIREAVIGFYSEKSTSDRAAQFAAELRNAAAITRGEFPSCPCLGTWRLHRQEGRWLLERDPPPGRLMFYFGVFLLKDADRWSPITDAFREEWTTIDE